LHPTGGFATGGVRPKKRYDNIKTKTTPTIKIPPPTIIPEEPNMID
jgi:hypothetical protein